MYINHELEETQYFDTNKSFVRIFLEILTGEFSFSKSNLKVFSDSIVLDNKFQINENKYYTKIIYENGPIKLRKIKITENSESFEIGFFNHNNTEINEKGFFSLINPYLIN